MSRGYEDNTAWLTKELIETREELAKYKAALKDVKTLLICKEKILTGYRVGNNTMAVRGLDGLDDLGMRTIEEVITRHGIKEEK